MKAGEISAITGHNGRQTGLAVGRRANTSHAMTFARESDEIIQPNNDNGSE